MTTGSQGRPMSMVTVDVALRQSVPALILRQSIQLRIVFVTSAPVPTLGMPYRMNNMRQCSKR